MAQYVFTMNRVGKIVPPKRQILKDISLSFFPGAKIGLIGLNGAGKPTLVSQKASKADDLRSKAEGNPLVQAIMETFPGAKIDAVRRKGEQTSLVAGLAPPSIDEPPPAEDYPADDDIPESEF